MSDQEILQRAIAKATNNGWSGVKKEGFGIFIPTKGGLYIYSHDFAKALWGDDFVLNMHLPGVASAQVIVHDQKVRRWQYHLQKMVIADNPIEYLGENI